MRSDQNPGVVINTVPPDQREKLVFILEESFEGWYLRHSKRTLSEIEVVKEAVLEGERVALIMLKHLGNKLGYVYYIAVAKRFRGRGIAGKLLDDALAYFFTEQGMKEVYAGVEEDNEESHRLFTSRGFKKTSRSDLARKYGTINSFVLLRKMVIVPGEVLLFCESPSPQGTTSSH